MTTIKPTFRRLKPSESRALLRGHHVGRLAFTFKDRVDIEPIGYVLNGTWLYMRTSPGTKVRQLLHHPWAAFEVDEIRGPFDWTSVVVHGTVYFLEDGPAHSDWEHALQVLRAVDPTSQTDDDLVPGRTVVFRMHIDAIAGRAASTRRSPKSAAKKRRAR